MYTFPNPYEDIQKQKVYFWQIPIGNQLYKQRASHLGENKELEIS